MVPLIQSGSPLAQAETPVAYPRSPVAELFHAQVQAVVGDRTVLQASRGVRILQQGLLPLYFLPASSLQLRHVRASDTLRIDDLGLAVHLHLFSGGHVARDAAWYYPGPDPDMAIIAGMICLNPARLDALFLDGQRVSAGEQPGSWITANLRGYVLHRHGAA